MVKTHRKSFFTMVSTNTIRGDSFKINEKEAVILQLNEQQSYLSTEDYPVHICEVVYKEDYEKENSIEAYEITKI